MSGVWLVIFYIVCLILARQVCVCLTDFSYSLFSKQAFCPHQIIIWKQTSTQWNCFLGHVANVIYSICARMSWVAVWTSCWIIAFRRRERRWRPWRTSTNSFYRMCCHFTWPPSSSAKLFATRWNENKRIFVSIQRRHGVRVHFPCIHIWQIMHFTSN